MATKGEDILVQRCSIGMHLGIIPDGNRRWAHAHAAAAGDDVYDVLRIQWHGMMLGWLRALVTTPPATLAQRWRGLSELTDVTIYFMTVENLQRNDSTVASVFAALQELYVSLTTGGLGAEYAATVLAGLRQTPPATFATLFPSFNLRINVVGSLHLLAPAFQAQLARFAQLLVQTLEGIRTQLQTWSQTHGFAQLAAWLRRVVVESTLPPPAENPDAPTFAATGDVRSPSVGITLDPAYPTYTVTLGFAYDPVADFVRVATGQDPRCQPPVDLVVRTGGEHRTSGFFPYHCIYSEYLFLSKYFPDLRLEDIETALAAYHRRQRRFGR